MSKFKFLKLFMNRRISKREKEFIRKCLKLKKKIANLYYKKKMKKKEIKRLE